MKEWVMELWLMEEGRIRGHPGLTDCRGAGSSVIWGYRCTGPRLAGPLQEAGGLKGDQGRAGRRRGRGGMWRGRPAARRSRRPRPWERDGTRSSPGGWGGRRQVRPGRARGHGRGSGGRSLPAGTRPEQRDVAGEAAPGRPGTVAPEDGSGRTCGGEEKWGSLSPTGKAGERGREGRWHRESPSPLSPRRRRAGHRVPLGQPPARCRPRPRPSTADLQLLGAHGLPGFPGGSAP